MSEYFVGTTGSNSQTTFESLTTSEVLDDLGLNTSDAPTFSGVFLDGSGSTIFSVDGSNGRLFGVTDEVTGTVFSVNDAAGLPIVEVESTSDFDKITLGEYGSDLLVLSGQTTAEVTGSQIATQSWISDQGFSADTNYYLTGIEKSSNTLNFKVRGSSEVSYTFGSNAFNSTTIPSAANDATITISAGTALGGGGNFTTDQSANETITINHDSISRSDTTSLVSLDFGDTVTSIDSITSNAQGHITAENTVTYTLPSLTSGDITGALGYTPVTLEDDGSIESEEFIGDLRGAVSFKAQAGEAIAKGEAVFISGISGNTTVVGLADANDATRMPAFGIASEAASANNPVTVINFGSLGSLDTDTPSWDEGDELYVSNTAGALTTTPPTSESSLLQKIAKVTRRDNAAGSITVMGAGRTNAVPNLNEGRLFVGNSSNEAVADDTAYVDIANSRVGIGTTSPAQKLHIASSSATNLISKLEQDNADYQAWYEANCQDGGFARFGIADNADNFAFWNTDQGSYRWFVASEKMRLTSDGNLGIGTTSPAQRLHVSGGHILLDNNKQIRFKDSGATERTIIQLNSSNDLAIGGSYAGALTFMGGGSYTEQMRIHDNGNVGIGTTSPADKLEVEDGNIRIETTTNTDAKLILNPYSSGIGNTYQWELVGKDSTNNYNFQIRENGTPYLTIENSVNGNTGNVGIGDTTPSYKLDVAGDIRATGDLRADDDVFIAGDVLRFTNDAASAYIQSADALILEADYDADDTGGKPITFKTAGTTKMTIAGGGDVTINNDLTVSGDLTVNGTTSTINSTTLQVDDKNIELGTVASPTDITADGGGITLKGATDKTINWVNSTDAWTFSNKVSTSEITTASGTLTLNPAGNYVFLPSGKKLYGSNIGFGYQSNAVSAIKFLLGASIDNPDMRIERSSSNLVIQNEVDDGDILFKGSDGGSTITALTLDMSDAGKATFAGSVTATSLIKSGGTSSEFLKADGTVDSTSYLPLAGGTITGNVKFNDNAELQLGSGSDLKIYHNAQYSYLDQPVGLLRVSAPAFEIVNADKDAYIARFFEGGNGSENVQLYYNGNKKFETATNGVNVTGNVIASNNVYAGGANGFVFGSSTSEGEYIYRNGNDIRVYAGGSDRLTVDGDDGRVGIGTTTPAEKLELFSASDVALRIHKSSVGEFRMGVAGSADSDTVQFVTNTNGFDFRGDSNTFPDGGSSRLFISSSGNVGIGTGSPNTSYGLNVVHTTYTALFESDDAVAVMKLANTTTGTGTTNGLEFYANGLSDSAVNAYGMPFSIKTSATNGTNPTARLTVSSGGNVVINESGASVDFRVEGNTDANLLFVDGSADKVGVGRTSPVSKLHVYQNDTATSTTAGITIEQDGTGDAQLQFLLSNVYRWVQGIDNSDGDKFKIGRGNDWAIGEDITITTSGEVGIGTTSPSAKLEVNGHFAATTKSFIVDNPKTGGKLQYGVVESDQHSVFVRGKNDTNTIELPEEWEWLVDEDSVTVQLTSIGQIQQLFVISQDNKTIKIGGLATNGKYNYTVYGERKDVEKLEVNI